MSRPKTQETVTNHKIFLYIIANSKPSIDRIVDATGYSKCYVYRCLKSMRENNLIEKVFVNKFNTYYKTTEDGIKYYNDMKLTEKNISEDKVDVASLHNVSRFSKENRRRKK